MGLAVPTGAVLCCALLAAAGPARAQDELLQPVVVDAPAPPPGEASRAPAAAASTVDVAGEAGEERSTAELLARTPGVVVHDYGGPGQLATLSLRGASAQQVLVLLDGVPITGAASGLVDLATLPPALLERIEVVRGGMGALYGAGALGGVVNLVARTPRPGSPEVDAEIRAGAFQTGEARLAASGSLGRGTALVALDALGTRGDFGFRPVNGTADVPRQNNDAAQRAALLRYVGPLGAGRSLDAQVQLAQSSRGLAGTVQNPSLSDRLDDGRTLASLRLDQPLSAGSLQLRGFARQERLEVALSGAAPTPQQDLLAGVEGRLARRAGHHGLSLLLRAAAEDVRQAHFAHQRPDLALGLADEWLLAGGVVSLLPALRLDEVDHFAGVSPQLAVVVRPAAPLELRGSVGQTFRAPTFAELYLDQGLVMPNPALDAERALAADLGASLEQGPLQLWAGGFVTEYVDLIEYELFPGARAKPFNVGTALVWGGEVEARLHPAKGLVLSGSFSQQGSRDIYDDVRFYGHALPGHPEQRGGARASYTAPRLTAHAEAFAQSRQFLSRANTTALPGRLETSAGAAWRLLPDQPIWAGLEAQNLLDERSEDLYGYPLPGRAFYALLRVAAALPPEHP